MNTAAKLGPSEVQNSAQICPYYDVVVGTALSDDLRAIGKASHARQIKGDYQDMNVHPGPLGWGLSVGLKTAPHSNMFC